MKGLRQSALVVLFCATAPAQVTVKWSEYHQTIDGFGVSQTAADPGAIILPGEHPSHSHLLDGWKDTPPKASQRTEILDRAFSTASNGIGISIFNGGLGGDSRGDIALVGGGSWTTIPVGFRNANGTSLVTNNVHADLAGWAPGSTVQAASGDFDGNGRADIALVGSAT